MAHRAATTPATQHARVPSVAEPSFLTPLLSDREFAVEYVDTLARMELIDDLVRAREALGVTQSAIARRMGVSQPTVSGFEHEASDPRLSTVQRYARAVGKRVVVTLTADPES
jgi:DNA-binding XRE family transcriptional regulator